MLFQYEWSLVNTTAVASTGGKMENGQEKMTVSGLGQGSYSFKVVVTGSDPRAEGEGLGVVTVLPREFTDGARYYLLAASTTTRICISDYPRSKSSCSFVVHIRIIRS